MSLADFDDVLFICCDWDSEKFRYEVIKIKVTRGPDLLDLKANWWETAEIPNDRKIREVEPEKEKVKEGVFV